MARKGKSTEEIIQALREAEVRLGQGETVGKICRGCQSRTVLATNSGPAIKETGMPQQPRCFTDFVPTLQLFIEEEFQGEALFGRLADYHQGKARHAFQLMAEIERGVIAAMQPAIARHDLQLADPKALYEEGRREAEVMGSMTWAEFLNHVHEDYPAFNDELDQLLRLAPAADRADAQLLVDHELAFTDFAAAERSGDPNSIDILTAFLRRVS